RNANPAPATRAGDGAWSSSPIAGFRLQFRSKRATMRRARPSPPLRPARFETRASPSGGPNMATATKKPSLPSSPSRTPQASPNDPWILRALDATYRFLSSLKLAVLSISTLAFTLIFATFVESEYGTGAAQEYVYRSRGFAILM